MGGGRSGRSGGGRRLRRLLRVPRPAREQAESDLDAEFELHLELRAQELEAEGLTPEEARREALRLFGDPEQARARMLSETTRHVRGQRGRQWFGDLIRDLRYATRSLLRSPGFTAVAVATLALGLGASTAVFSVVDTVLLEPLPLPEPERLAMIWEASEPRDAEDHNVVNPANFMAWRDRSEAFQSMAAVYTMPVTLLAGGAPQQVQMQLAHFDLFRVLGARPVLGRGFVPEEATGAPGGAPVVVLSHAFWQEHFGGDPGVIGRPLELVGSTPEVIGVMGEDVEFFAPDVAFWTPTDYRWGSHEGMGRFIRVVGRLAPGVGVEAAESEMRSIMDALAEEVPDFNTGWSANVVPLDEQVKGDIRPTLLVLLGAVLVLLLVTCVNVANLLLVRASARRTETAVRASLGASRGRIVRELATQSLLLSCVGGLLGAALAYGATRVMAALLPASLRIPRLDQVTVDLEVLAFAAGLVVITGLVFGLVPALDAFRADLVGQLRAGGRGAGGGHRSHRLRSAIVVGEVALSLILLIGAGLLLRSFERLQSTELGVRPENVVTGRVTMQGERYSEGGSRAAFVDRAVASIAALPEVRSVGALSWLPLTGAWSADGYYLPGQPRPAPNEMMPTEVQAVEGEIFDALGVPFVAGRRFTPAEAAGDADVAIVSRAFVEQTWPGQNAIGRRFILTWGDGMLLEVVGVVGDVRQRDVQSAGQPAAYIPHGRLPSFQSMNIVVRTNDDFGTAIGPRIASRIHDLDPSMALANITTLEEVVSEAVARPRLATLAVTSFALLALLLAALGIYGVLAYAVSLRGHELSLRQALGAASRDVARLVLREAFVLAAIGVAIGTLAAFFATRILATQLYEVSRLDPVVFLAMPALLLAIALTAGLLPAWRAARVQPSRVIRDE